MRTKLERIQKDIERLAVFNANPGNGLTRLSFTEEHKKAQDYIISQMEDAGLSVRVDACGTIIGRLEGEDSTAACVMTGSHFDSVRCGGNFDGQAGVAAALETARVFKDEKIRPVRPVEFIAMIEEEGTRFGSGLFASRAMTGKVTAEELAENKDADGISTGEAMRAFGLEPSEYKAAVHKKGEIQNFLELHIEQGPILEAAGVDVGIVETIVGIQELEIIIKGRPDHAGTTPMDMRADAMLAASKVAVTANEAAVAAGEGTVATVGKLEIKPGSFNIVPGEVDFFIDIRSKKQVCIDKVRDAVTARLDALIAENSGLTYELKIMLETLPVDTDGSVCSLFEQNAESLGFSSRRMLSGAGHDAMVMANITDIGLIFVQSKGGRSHCPDEWTDYALLQKGAEVLCKTVESLACGKVGIR